MRETKRGVVVHGGDQVGVVRQLEQSQVGRGVPAGRSDYDDTIGVGLANDAQCPRREHVPRLAVEPTVRFVVEFEHQPGTAPLKVRSQLLPQYYETHIDGRSSDGRLAGIESVTIELPVVV